MGKKRTACQQGWNGVSVMTMLVVESNRKEKKICAEARGTKISRGWMWARGGDWSVQVWDFFCLVGLRVDRGLCSVFGENFNCFILWHRANHTVIEGTLESFPSCKIPVLLSLYANLPEGKQRLRCQVHSKRSDRGGFEKFQWVK